MLKNKTISRVIHRRKMKGLSVEESLKTYIEVAFFVITITGILFAVSTYIISFDSVLAETSTTLDAIDAAYMIDACLSGKNHYMDAETLTSKEESGEDIVRTCGIIREGLGVEVEDMEASRGGKKWDFGYSDMLSRHKHSIFVNIKVGDDIHLGELRTKIVKNEYDDSIYSERGGS